MKRRKAPTAQNRQAPVLGVVGAGTMGSGIALAALYQGLSVTLVDVSERMLEQAQTYIAGHLQRKGLEHAGQLLSLAQDLQAVAGCQVVIEAVPERLELKQSLFGELDRRCPPPVILASNTSTLSVSAIAAAAQAPGRVAGMHFFNPAPLMPLVEVVRAAQTTQQTVDRLVELALQLGKTPVVTRDTPGFIVNRVARPYYGEALRLLGEGVAGHAEIDLLARSGAGFPMGPFELMDLIGIDVNFAAAQSMHESTFGEPRYRPHPLQRQMLLQGKLGRKSGAGFYDYGPESTDREPPQPPPPQAGSGYLLVSNGSWAPRLPQVLSRAGYALSETHGELPRLALVVSGRSEGAFGDARRYDRGLSPEIPLLCQMADLDWGELASELDHPERLVGYDGLFAGAGSAVTLVRGESTAPIVADQAEGFLRGLGWIPVWVKESPGLVLPRMVCCLVNEAAFALQEGVADVEGIDLAMKLGVRYPQGPLEWAEQLGHARVVAVLDHLHRVFAEERYRVAPLLRRWVRMGAPPSINRDQKGVQE